MRHSFLSKLLGKFERVGPHEIQNVFLRLVKEKGFLEAIFNSLQEGVVVLDNRGKIQYANMALQRLFGVNPEEVLGKEIKQCVPLIDWPELIALEKMVSRDFQVFYPEPRYLNLSLIPLEEMGNKNAAFIAIFYDITASREKTLEVIETEKLNLLTMLAAGVAHELGNPINALSIHFQLLEKRFKKLLQKTEEKGEKEIENSFAAIRSELRRLDGIINQFLKAIRPSPPKLRLLSVNQLIKQTVEFLSPEFQNLDILLELHLDRGLPLLRADKNQLKQAFYNILKNGIEAVGKNGIIKISTHYDDSFLTISFQDNGGGIPQEVMSQVFKPYFTTKASGTGLGLLIVRRIIRDHGGEVQIESENGKGTTVKILLPRAERLVRLLPMAQEKS
ncbi:PAS domain-containing sensor histidine kinase [Candidatus Methylacidiphilum fumarolicum]|uniref:histidine kinase n=2 Tax=Candidatus Methylacidiphilum fumarolicum TaxID=591154 RepID=I0K0Q2_METFB|nr:ATP-binding protein [Candidatus Methylacidiphilum fumarolicum]MBW6414773.1 PAS domain-containing protein [Candidatus Methylacidiphilum fumarolicum]TFE67503.1 PAS domain-containing sensor histidine kinase [Candidatus Methylacidiphilum fumarolicum]TFE71418.1 PAS domain-containing sensor histidine kinase [Candidatus Methylacidiphilum fumarolicum]TFE73099.1 PAS domain-containing sensor histidine kinase [Candidatus Methylacidiphilum fumarolicum]TFE77075.1 PAS domain-containing sensor histidine k